MGFEFLLMEKSFLCVKYLVSLNSRMRISLATTKKGNVSQLRKTKKDERESFFSRPSHVPGGQLLEGGSSWRTLMTAVEWAESRDPGGRVRRDSWGEGEEETVEGLTT